jgi:outer membrane autotransporter protein
MNHAVSSVSKLLSLRLMAGAFAVGVGISTTWSEIAHGSYLAETKDVADSSVKATTSAVIDHVVSTVTNHVRMLGGATGAFNVVNSKNYAAGISAGDSSTGYAIWFTPSYSDFENNGGKKVGLDYDGDLTTVLVGFDAVINKNLVFGATIGYEDSNSDFDNNSKADSDGYVGAIYGAYNFSQATAYLNTGFIFQDNDLDDYSLGPNTLSKGSFDSDTYFVNIGVMRSTQLSNDWIYTIDGSYSYADTETDSYTDSLARRIKSTSSYLSEIMVNSEVAKVTDWGEYYGTVGVGFDLQDDNDYNNGDIGVDLGLGLRFNPSDNLTGEISVKKLFLKKDEEDVTYSANLRYEF